MHTAICSFDERATAERAVERLVQSGFARADVHLEHRPVTAEGDNSGTEREALEREGAVDRSILGSFGAFFASLFGRDQPESHVDTWSQAVERGSFVVVVDGRDEADARRAQTLMREMEAAEAQVVDRAGQRPLRDIVGGAGEPAATQERSRKMQELEGEATGAPEVERAMASGTMGGSPTLGARNDPDLVHAPGLRYADKDKPM
jgi:hypothetical protein